MPWINVIGMKSFVIEQVNTVDTVQNMTPLFNHHTFLQILQRKQRLAEKRMTFLSLSNAEVSFCDGI